MSRVGTPEPDPSVIGNIPKPPFVRLPDPVRLFAVRAERFRWLADGHPLAPYLNFLADLSAAQSAIQEGLPEPEPVSDDVLARAREHKMPPLDRGSVAVDPAFAAAFERLIAAAEGMEMPDAARAALARIKATEPAAREIMIGNVLAEAIPVEAIAEHVFVAAALQVHFARLAARLDAKALQDIGDGVCPACGGAPSASLVEDWQGAGGVRFCACSLCATEWNYVRARCTLCGSTKSVKFQEVEGGGGTVKAETCDECRGYVKVLYRQKAARLDPIADDVATLGLDLLVKELGFRRGAVNPFMVGY
ncbi:MAG: formate dehydrogenase accessory protein FdhE [Bradyrhizobiaceae bacterium]|nr:formate dehydrogenase accessory protein FdhE [Bradyrhizobiaceae bacterium]